jgi:hypothetical protein
MRDWRWSTPTVVAILALLIFYRLDCSGTVYLAALGCLVGATALIWLLSLGGVRGTDHRSHGRRTGLLYIGVTYGFAAAYALIMYRTYEGSKGALGNAGKDFMLTSGLVGGVLALFRSTGTNSAVLATLNRLDRLDRELVGPTIALEAQDASTIQELELILERMMNLATHLREAPFLDSLSLWFRDQVGGRWRILEGAGLTPETIDLFEQPILTQQQPGAGFICNMAAVNRRVLVVPSDPRSHPWYANDPNSSKNLEGFACVLLLDHNLQPIGALCLTSARKDGIPRETAGASYHRFTNALNLWAASFTIVLERCNALLREGPIDE